MFGWHSFARQQKAMRQHLRQAVKHYDGRKLQGQVFLQWKGWCNLEGRANVRSNIGCHEFGLWNAYKPVSQATGWRTEISCSPSMIQHLARPKQRQSTVHIMLCRPLKFLACSDFD